MAFDLEQSFLISTELAFSISQEHLWAAAKLKPYELGPLLQGVMMEHVDTEYATVLHNLPFNPYSQYVISRPEGLSWVINTLSEQTYDKLVAPLLSADNLWIKKHDIPLTLKTTEQNEYSFRTLVNLVSAAESAENPTRFILHFLTPTSFRQAGVYQILPDARLIFQNALMRYGSLVDSDKEADAETVDYLACHTRIVKYNLKSCPFSIGGSRNTKIPAFIGTMTLSVKGPAPLRGLAHMLLRFSEFGGLGIKTSMGMGGFRLK